MQGLLYLFVLVEIFGKRTCRPLSDFNTKIYLLLKWAPAFVHTNWTRW